MWIKSYGIDLTVQHLELATQVKPVLKHYCIYLIFSAVHQIVNVNSITVIINYWIRWSHSQMPCSGKFLHCLWQHVFSQLPVKFSMYMTHSHDLKTLVQCFHLTTWWNLWPEISFHDILIHNGIINNKLLLQFSSQTCHIDSYKAITVDAFCIRHCHNKSYKVITNWCNTYMINKCK